MRLGDLVPALVLLTCAIFSSACDAGRFGQDYELQRAHLDPRLAADSTIRMPTEALALEGVSITVTTFGDGCRRKGRAIVSVLGSVVTIEPHDSVCVSCSVCNSVRRVFEHEAVVQFASAGQGVVQVIGLIMPADTLGVVESAITIRDP